MLKDSTISVTKHAMDRAIERLGNMTCADLISKVKSATLLKKNGPIPFDVFLRSDTNYAINKDILYVLEPVDYKSYKLVTVFTDKFIQDTEVYPNQFISTSQLKKELAETQNEIHKTKVKMEELKVKVRFLESELIQRKR